VARTIFAAAAVTWIVAGLVGVGIGLAATSDLQRMLPKLTIDLSALGGAVVAVSVGVLAVGLVHAAVLLGMRGGSRASRSAAIVLAAAMTALLVALSAAAAVSAVTVPDQAIVLLGATVAAAGAATAYAVVAVLLVREMRARPTT